ncbi:hypothetical protein KF840_06950 [bacterium]|nr:hypothetical protein [bacterium]
MLRPIALLSCCAALLAGALAVHAAERGGSATLEADRALLVNTVRANRRALVAVNLNLSSEQAAQFWPLYDRYQTEITAIGDRGLAVVADYVDHYAELSNDKALELMTDYLAAEAERLKVRQSYLPEFAKILPGRTVARFYQIENKIDAVLRYDLAESIPVLEQSPASGK